MCRKVYKVVMTYIVLNEKNKRKGGMKMEIELVFKRKLVAKVSMEELRMLIRKYKKRLPYKIVLTTNNDEDIRKLEQLKIPYVLNWKGKWS